MAISAEVEIYPGEMRARVPPEKTIGPGLAIGMAAAAVLAQAEIVIAPPYIQISEGGV